jgi:hypothetical protein
MLPTTQPVAPVWLSPPHCPYKLTVPAGVVGDVVGTVTVTVTGFVQAALLERVKVTKVVGSLRGEVGFTTVVVVPAGLLVATGAWVGETLAVGTAELGFAGADPDAPSQTAGPGIG